MNPATWNTYEEYLARTGDVSAAASLTLADALQLHTKGVSSVQPLTVPEVAKLLRVQRNKVLSWIRDGKLKAFNVTQKPSGRPKYRINQSDVDAFMRLPAVNLPVQRGRPMGRRVLSHVPMPTL